MVAHYIRGGSFLNALESRWIHLAFAIQTVTKAHVQVASVTSMGGYGVTRVAEAKVRVARVRRTNLVMLSCCVRR